VVEQVHRDQESGPDACLFVAPTGVEIHHPDLSARWFRHGSLLVQTIGHGNVPELAFGLLGFPRQGIGSQGFEGAVIFFQESLAPVELNGPGQERLHRLTRLFSKLPEALVR
jgi:hypothetical protein